MQKSSNRGWSTHEDLQLQKLVAQSQDLKIHWVCLAKELSSLIGRQRTGKQCRQRWQHQLNPEIRRQAWTHAQTQKLFELHKAFGNKWSIIAQHLPGRTDNITKNYFYAYVRKNITKINSLLRSRDCPLELSQIRPFDCEFTSKLILVSDGNFQRKVRLNSHDLRDAAREILQGVIGLGDEEGGIGRMEKLIPIMHNFRLNSKKKKQSKKARQEQRFLKEEQNLFLSCVTRGEHREMDQRSSQERLERVGETKGINAIPYRPYASSTSLQEEDKEHIQVFFSDEKERSEEPSTPSAEPPSLLHHFPQVEYDLFSREADEQMEAEQFGYGVLNPQPSLTHLWDPLHFQPSAFTCIFTREDEEWQFKDGGDDADGADASEFPLDLPLQLELTANDRKFSVGEMLRSATWPIDEEIMGIGMNESQLFL